LGASQDVFEEAYESLLVDIEKRGVPVYVTSCFSIDPDYNDEWFSYSMIFPLKNTKTFNIHDKAIPGILIQRDKDGTIANMAKLVFSHEDHSLVISEANGGIWTYKKLRKIINQISKYKSSKTASKNVRKALKKSFQTNITCE
jgi:fructose-1,6-bisphosphatase